MFCFKCWNFYLRKKSVAWERVQPVSTRVLSLFVKTSKHKQKILTMPKLGPKKTVLVIAFIIALTIDVKTAWIGCQVAIFVSKNIFFGLVDFKKFNIGWLLHKLLIYELNKWVSSITVLTLPPSQEFCNFRSTFPKVKFLLELLGHFFALIHQILEKKCPTYFGYDQPPPPCLPKIIKKNNVDAQKVARHFWIALKTPPLPLP